MKKYGKRKSGFGQEEEFQSGVRFGYLYRTVEEYIESFTAQEGGTSSVTDNALRVARFLEAKALREERQHSELVSQVREDSQATDSGRGTESGTLQQRKKKDVHVRSRGTRTLSVVARKRIVAAQRKRWREYKRRRRNMKTSASKPARRYGWEGMTAEERKVEMRRRMTLRKKVA